MGVLVGVDIGGTKTAVVLGRPRNDTLDIIDRAVFLTEPGVLSWRDAVGRVVDTAHQLLRKHAAAAGSVAGIGISCGGPLDSKAGLIQSPPNLPGWADVPITLELERALGVRAFLQNDANACALAEWRFGAGRGTRNMVFLTFGTGMGAGLILDGRLYEGTNGLAGEAGHIRLAADGPEGYGKRGSFEGYCSGGGIARLARSEAEKRLAAGQPVAFCQGTQALAGISAEAVGRSAEAGDPLALEIFALSGTFLGRALALIIDLLNPQRIVIGSVYARCRRFIEPSMKEEIAREALAPAAQVCEVVPAVLGETIGDYACLSAAMGAGTREREEQ
ncbi:MAG TPA: ROK family protein [Spirochaetia bacterium]|nr:ROK family protein [Spirochaetia bacterium]